MAIMNSTGTWFRGWVCLEAGTWWCFPAVSSCHIFLRSYRKWLSHHCGQVTISVILSTIVGELYAEYVWFSFYSLNVLLIIILFIDAVRWLVQAFLFMLTRHQSMIILVIACMREWGGKRWVRQMVIFLLFHLLAFIIADICFLQFLGSGLASCLIF